MAEVTYADPVRHWRNCVYMAEVVSISISVVATLPSGVLQGSVLGPMLCTIYTLPIRDTARTHGLNVHFYADDTQLYTWHLTLLTMKMHHQYSRRLKTISVIYVS